MSGATKPTGPGPDPATVVARAVAELQNVSFRFRSTDSIHGPDHNHHVEDLSFSGDAENSERVDAQEAIDPNTPVHMVLYDGDGYVAGEGGSYRHAPFVSETTNLLFVGRIQAAIGHLESLHDQGPRRVDGVDAEHFDASVPVAYATEWHQQQTHLMKQWDSSAGDASAGFSYTAYAMGFDIERSTGRLVAVEITDKTSIDLAAASRAFGRPGMGTGVLLGSEDVNVHFTDYGAAIKVTRPSTSGTISLNTYIGMENGQIRLP